MNPLDFVALAAMAFGAWRGRARGLPVEAYRLLRLAVAFAAGVGLYRLLARAIRAALAVGGEVSGTVAFVASVLGAWALTRRLKRAMTAFIAARWARHARTGGAVAGAVRALLLIVLLEGLLQLAGKPEGSPGGRFSVVGRLAAWTVSGR